jgi:IS30 family transposase
MNIQDIASELHKPVRKIKNFRKVISRYKNNIWSLDLVEMIQFKDVNKGYNYILVIVDVYSRYCWAIPLKNKTGKDVSNAIENIIKNFNSPEHFWTDEGKEFYNKDVDKLRDKYNINIYSTYGVAKSAIVERLNRTLKNIMYK